MTSLLDDVIAQIQGLSDEDRLALTEEVVGATDNLIWIPTPGPQTDAYFSEADELFFGGSPGGGKGVSVDTYLPTVNGFKLMKDIQIGDRLFDEEGKLCNVIFVSDVHYRRCFRFEFDDGSEIIADDEHRWFTSTNKDRLDALKLTDEYRSQRQLNRASQAKGKKSKLFTELISKRNSERDYNYKEASPGSVKNTLDIFNSLRRRDGGTNHAIENCSPLELDDADLPISPFLLGIWLGDGCSSNPSVGMMQSDMEEVLTHIDNRIISKKTNVSDKYNFPFTVVRFGDMGPKLKALGLFKNKHIPMCYLRSSVKQRIELLQGILDTDGSVGHSGAIELGLSNRRLIEDVYELVSSLGIKSKINTKRLSLKSEKWNDSHRIKFMAPFPAFKLKRKLVRQKLGDFRDVVGRRFIIDVKEVDTVPTRCIQVDSPNHMYLVGRSMIPTHNSDLGVGLSLTVHKRTLFLRRQREEAKEIADRYFDVLGTRDGWNGQDLKLRTKDGRVIDVGGCNLENDKQKYKGIPHSLKFFDEIGDFTESQFRFIIIWNRSTNPGERCRVICAGNPPTTPEGLWVLKYWGPWLDPTHPDPAQPGELRWYLGTEDGDVEVDGPGPYEVTGLNGKKVMVRAKSRTFIPSSLNDNPYLRDTNYESVLAGLTGDMRNAYFLGKFDATLKDKPNQVIPTSWIREAQQRWTPQRPKDVPMCAIGVDPTGGGEDECVLAPRYDGWYAPVIGVPAKQVPFGKDIAGLVIVNRRNQCVVIMDMGGGFGGAPYEILKDNGVELVKYEGYKSSNLRTTDGKMKFVNDRSAAYWRFREALDPSQDGGSPIALPDDPSMVADLTAPTFKITPNGIAITAKEDLIQKLRRSPNRGDAVVMAWWHGAKGIAQPSRTSLEQGTFRTNVSNGANVNFGRGNRGGSGVNFGRRG